MSDMYWYGEQACRQGSYKVKEGYVGSVYLVAGTVSGKRPATAS